MKLIIILLHLWLLNASTSRPTQHLVDVRLVMATSIRFIFHKTDDFEPLRLYANISSGSGSGRSYENSDVIFTSTGGREITVFHNMYSLLKLQMDDVIHVQLTYRPSKTYHVGLPNKQIKFDYTITDKLSDTISIDLLSSTPLDSDAPNTHSMCSEKSKELNTAERLNIQESIWLFDNDLSNSEMMVDIVTGQNCQCAPQTEAFIRMKQLLHTSFACLQFNKRLLLNVHPPSSLPAVAVVRHFIMNELDLASTAQRILQAKEIDEGLLFEMETAGDTVEVLTRARLMLKGKSRGITISDREFHEVRSLARMGT